MDIDTIVLQLLIKGRVCKIQEEKSNDEREK